MSRRAIHFVLLLSLGCLMAPGAYAQSASGAERMAEDPVYRKLVADYAQATYFKGLSETEALQYLEGVHPTHAEYVAFIRLYPGSPKVPEFKKTIADFKAFAAQPDANSARSGFTGLPRSLFDDRCFEPGFETFGLIAFPRSIAP